MWLPLSRGGLVARPGFHTSVKDGVMSLLHLYYDLLGIVVFLAVLTVSITVAAVVAAEEWESINADR